MTKRTHQIERITEFEDRLLKTEKVKRELSDKKLKKNFIRVLGQYYKKKWLTN